MKFFKKAFLLSLIFIAVLATLASCSGKKKVTLSAEKSEISVLIGETVELKLSATEVKKYTEEDILSNLDIVSSDANVVKVENDSLTAVGLGTANVTATWKEYEGATVTVKVNVLAPEVGSVTYSQLPSNVYVGDEFSITHEAGSDVTVSYEVSNAEVLSVEGNNFKALAKGSAKITATATNGYKEVKQEWNVEVLQGEFTITYELNGGKNASSNPTKYDVRNLPLAIAAATKANKTFLGWSLVEGSTEYVTEIAAGQTGDITLYANFADIKHAITYELDGGTLGAKSPVEYVQGEETQLVNPTKEGYTFLGWSTVEGSTTYITKIARSLKADVKLYANWEKIPVFSNIVYHLDGGTNPSNAQDKYQEGTCYILPIPTKEGYQFVGWTKVLQSIDYITQICENTFGEVELYAHWMKLPVKHAISYELNGGTNPEGAATEFEEGIAYTLPTPTKEGYEFLGWTKEAESTEYITEISATETAEVKVYAQWKQKEQPGEEENAVYVGAGLDYATLDEAVAGAPEGSKIILAAGEYVLSIVVTKSLEIVGPNANLPVSEFGTGEALINVKKDIAGNIAAANLVFNGVHLKGTGGGDGISGVFFQDGGGIETVTFKSCVVSDMNTFIKFNGATSKSTVIIENSHLHTIGQFMVWVQNAQTQKVILRSNLVDASNCGGVTNAAAALFRLRSGSLEAYDNLFKGDSLNAPGFFELSAADGKSIVKYNTFDGVSKYLFTSKDNNAVFNENLYLDFNGKAMTSVPSTLTANGLTADATLCTSEEDRAARYLKELIALNPERYSLVEYELNGGELTSAAPAVYDKEAGIQNLPTIEREGYLFLGWYLNDELVEAVPAGLSGAIKLVAKWREPALVVDGTTSEGHYETLAAALAAVKEGETIKLVAGEYAGDVTIDVANIKIVGPNAGINANNGTRVAEAVIKGVFNLTSKAQNLTIDGLSFTGAAKVVYPESVNYNGFVFQNNKVYDTTDSAKAWDESRYSLPGFLQFTMSGSSVLSNVQVYNNSFVNVSEVNVLANRVSNMTVDGNVFKDFDLDAIRTEGGLCSGVLAFTNNVFEQTTAGNGNNGIFLYSIAGGSNDKTYAIIKNNSFIKLGKDNGTVFSGAISSYRFQENYTEIEIENNIFDHCYDYLYLRNNGGNATNWFCTVENNQFLGLPTNQYYGSYRGSDSESSNPHLAVFTKNYYEDNDGQVISDLSQYASYFKHMASYGEALAAKPGEVEVAPVEFWTISYELNGGTTRDSFTYEYNSLNNAPIALPVLTLPNHNFDGWLLNGVLVNEIPADAKGDLVLVAEFTVLEGEVYTIEFVTNKQNVIWPSRAALDREEIIAELFKDLYEWAQGNGETRSYADYEAYINGELKAYNDIKLRNTKLGNYPAEDGSTEFFFNVPKYYQKWNEFFAVFNTAMLAVNTEQVFYTDTYATMVRLYQFVSWSSTGQNYFSGYLSKMCKAAKIPQEIPTSYRGGQVLNLPQISLANGLEFLGWYDNAELTGTPITSISATDAGNKVYYAKWAAEVKVETVEINKISELLLFTTHQLVWTLAPANATDLTVEFFSSNEAVATVSAKGLITALANGKTTITMRVYGNRELDVVFELEVFVNDYIDGSYESESYVVIDETIKLNASVVKKDGTTGSVKWTSLNPEIATVDENGVVTAINAGTAKIVAEDVSNPNLKLEFAVVVLSELPEDILGLAIDSHESNTFTRYDLNIGATYNKDILGSVSKLLGNSPLVKDTKYYEASNQSAATYGTMASIEFITVHYTGNMAAGADAAANASYFATNGSTSIHYTTGNDGVFYCMDESKGAWHAGDSGALAQVGEFKWIATGVQAAAGDPMYPNFTISDDFYYEINGKKTTVKMPNPWNYSNRNTDHVLNADGTISSKAGYSSTGFTGRTPESFINDQGLPFMIKDGQYYMGTTWWCYTQVYEGRICGTGGNRNSIGIESCVNEGSDLWWTWQKTAQLVADIMVRQNLDITRVRGHHFFSGKNCPQPMLENDQEIWYEFLELVEAQYELLTKYAGYEVAITSNNPDIVDNNGRVVKQPTETTCVTYTITFTKAGESKSITLASMVKGLYVDR